MASLAHHQETDEHYARKPRVRAPKTLLLAYQVWGSRDALQEQYRVLVQEANVDTPFLKALRETIQELETLAIELDSAANAGLEASDEELQKASDKIRSL